MGRLADGGMDVEPEQGLHPQFDRRPALSLVIHRMLGADGARPFARGKFVEPLAIVPIEAIEQCLDELAFGEVEIATALE